MQAVREIPARRGTDELTASLTFSIGDVCTIEVQLSDGGREVGHGPDLFEALVAVRRLLETRGVSLACNGARVDVYPSPMQRQATQGRRAYVLGPRDSKERPLSVDIFDPADWSVVTTAGEQREAFLSWLGDDPRGRNRGGD